MILLVVVGITIAFLLAIFLAGIIGAWLVEQFFGLGE
jgi:uncharacterized membrane protein